ncbi:hypothetical protein K501DRAFT_267541 [Backusella circina FSU 941]|nr:hypothetical protein K501DRAFT_267541 [Backusella circina FSU 941]
MIVRGEPQEHVSRTTYVSFKKLKSGANQNNANAQNNVGTFYTSEMGVCKDGLTAIEYYLKAAAMDNIDHRFLNGRGSTFGKYKALEWYDKCRKNPGEVEKLNREYAYLRKEDKFTILANEAEDIRGSKNLCLAIFSPAIMTIVIQRTALDKLENSEPIPCQNENKRRRLSPKSI